MVERGLKSRGFVVLRVAIFHDYFGAIGGGEKVAVEIAKILDADIITTDSDAITKIDPTVRLISLGKTIGFPPLKQISAAIKFRTCDFSKNYDFFIFTGNWSHAAASRHRPNLWYCYTPVRAFYDLYAVFLSRQDLLTRQLFRIWTLFHRIIDQRSVAKVDRIIAISANVRTRIQRYYDRYADVIYPPVDTSLYECKEYGNFWLSVNRLYPEKRIELQVEAFRHMPGERLIIAGGYARGDHAARYAKKIIKDLPSNVTIRGEVTDEELRDLYSRCRGHICTALDEDYGLTPLEAMASGKPIVAVDEGGYRETLTKDTGIFVKPEIGEIINAVRVISRHPEQYHDVCVARAREFDIVQFRKQVLQAVAGTFQ